MDYKKQAEDLVNQHKIVLMSSENTLMPGRVCNILAKKHAEITVNALIMASYAIEDMQRLAKVKKAILDL